MNYRSTFLITLFAIFITYSGVAQTIPPDTLMPHFPKEELSGVNTRFIEARPLITGNGNILYFVRRYFPDNFSGVKDYQDVYVSYRDTVSGKWSEGISLGKKVNNKRRNAIASISDDGEDGIFFNMYKKTRDLPLVRMRKSGDKWTDPIPIDIENYANVNPYSDFFVDFKNKVMFLAIESDSTIGEQDLYISFPNGRGGWKEPVNLGVEINTKLSEFAPFMGADGRSLFFCSYGHNSMGGADIFLSIRLDESWLKWSTPVNLGPSINSSQEESYFSIDNNFEFLYYTTYTPRQTDRNIARVKLPDDFTAINGPVLVQLDSADIRGIMASGNYEINTKGYRSNLEGISFEGWPDYQDAVASTDQDIEEEIIPETQISDNTVVEDMDEDDQGSSAVAVSKSPTNSESDVEPSSRYTDFNSAASISGLSAEAQKTYNYLKEALPDLDFLVKEDNGQIFFKVVQNLEYDFNSVYVNSNSLIRLRNTANALKAKPELSIELLGHTDNVGSTDANERVATQRVKNLAYYFKQRGVSEDRIQIVGLGDSEPLIKAETEDQLKKNRRVETIISIMK